MYCIKEVGNDYRKFSIDRETGVVRSMASFDLEIKNEYYVTVIAEDGAPSNRSNHYPPGTPNRGRTLNIVVFFVIFYSLLNVNDRNRLSYVVFRHN